MNEPRGTGGVLPGYEGDAATVHDHLTTLYDGCYAPPRTIEALGGPTPSKIQP